MIWFVYALPLPIMVALLVRLAPVGLRHRIQGYALALSCAVAAGLIALPPSTGWALQARYHLLSTTPVYARFAADGLIIIAAVALLMTTAWDTLVRQVDRAPISGTRALVVTAALTVFMSGNAMTLLLTWSAFGLLRAILAANDRDARTRPVIAGELASLSALLAAMRPLGLAGLSTPLFPYEGPALTSWLLIAACALRMGLYPLQTERDKRSGVPLASALTGLYLLLRASPPQPAIARVLVVLAFGASAMSFRFGGTQSGWAWLLQHALILVVLGATIGGAGGLGGLALLVCVALCQPALRRLQEDHHHLWDLVALLALGGIAPMLGWASWTRLLGQVSQLGPRWTSLLLGGSFALCAWVLGHSLRRLRSSGALRWHELLRWQSAWRSLPALALLTLGIWPSLLDFHGQAPAWAGIASQPELATAGVSWSMALGVAALAAISAGLGWSRPSEQATADPESNEDGGAQAMRLALDTIERIRVTIADIDITLRDHATLTWTILAAAVLLLWLRGR